MPSKEIKELRQSGQLEEALTMAQNELEAAPDNIWGKRNLSWVYYEYLKKYAHEHNYEGFIENLTKLKELNLPESETMLFDNCAWQIGSMIFSIQKKEPIDYSKINELFEIIKDFHFTKPSEAYSFIYKAFHKGYQNWSSYLYFADWWNLENLRPEDFLKEEFNEQVIMSVAEQAYIAYSKKLLEGEALDAFGQQRAINVEKIEAFLPKLDVIIANHPEYQYPPYYKAKLLLALGSDENVLSAFLPFAKQKRNDFWVWELMADIFSEDKELQFACYCKALSLKTADKFLLKLREAFVKLLLDKEMYNEAKTEINNIITTREKEDWKLSSQILTWREAPWFIDANEYPNNHKLYRSYKSKAEELLFQQIPEEVVAVEFVNKDKKMVNFIKNQSFHGFFSIKTFDLNLRIGDLIMVRLEAVGNDGYYKALTLKKADDSNLTNLECLKTVHGSIKINEQFNFGFVEDVFIHSSLIKKYQLQDGDEVSCKAMLSFNKKKDEWGWKCFSINE